MQKYQELNQQQSESETDTFTADRYRQFYHFMPRNAETVLDIGCNTGRGGQILKQLDSRLKIAGLDIVANRLARLPDDVYQQKINGPSTDIPAPDYSFDAVVAGEFIEHLYAGDVAKTLAEVFRVLKIGGRLLLTTPNPEDIKRRLRHQTVLGGAHLSQHFAHVLKLQLMMTGFSNVKIYGSGKVSRYLGYRFPLLAVYGSYMATADKF